MKRLPLSPSHLHTNIEFKVGTIFWCMEEFDVVVSLIFNMYTYLDKKKKVSFVRLQ